jgi:2,3-diketo-5-methylthio-1-phosphopentane phosphatase
MSLPNDPLESPREPDTIGEPAAAKLHIFCDFDGTISTVDIGDALFDRFSNREPWLGELMARRLHIREYWIRVAAALYQPLTLDALDAFLREVPIDPGFDDLLAVRREHRLPFTIVSDGLDLYIERYLTLHGIEPLPIFCNRATLTPDGALEIGYPLAWEGCDCFCATCKRNVVLTEADPAAIIVYIGDGVSDFCPAEHADIVFAKKSLAAYCNEHRIPHHPFATLADVARQLRQLIARRRIRPRHQAALRRKQAFEGE